MPRKFYVIVPVRSGRRLASIRRDLDLDDPDTTPVLLRQILRDAVVRDRRHLEQVGEYGLEIRESAMGRLVVPIFHATYEEVRALP
jgi:hypothetical protein